MCTAMADCQLENSQLKKSQPKNNLKGEDAEGRHRPHLVGERHQEVAGRGKRLEAREVPHRGRERLHQPFSYEYKKIFMYIHIHIYK